LCDEKVYELIAHFICAMDKKYIPGGVAFLLLLCLLFIVFFGFNQNQKISFE